MENQSAKLTYTANGDYFIPNLVFSEAATVTLGKYGRMRKKYLQEHCPGLFNRLALSEQLYPHCAEIDPPPEAELTLSCRSLLRAREPQRN